MARIAGVDLPREKRVEIGLTYIYGIGRVSSNKISTRFSLGKSTPAIRAIYVSSVFPSKLLLIDWGSFSTRSNINSTFPILGCCFHFENCLHLFCEYIILGIKK